MMLLDAVEYRTCVSRIPPMPLEGGYPIRSNLKANFYAQVVVLTISFGACDIVTIAEKREMTIEVICTPRNRRRL